MSRVVIPPEWLHPGMFVKVDTETTGQLLRAVRDLVSEINDQGKYAEALTAAASEAVSEWGSGFLPARLTTAMFTLRDVLKQRDKRPQLIPSGSELYAKWKADQGAAAVGSGARGDANDGGPATRQPPTLSDDAVDALHTLYMETADYITLNHLGPVHHNQSMKNARDVLKAAGFQTWYDGPASNELPSISELIPANSTEPKP